jgi:hypothetical protein
MTLINIFMDNFDKARLDINDHTNVECFDTEELNATFVPIPKDTRVFEAESIPLLHITHQEPSIPEPPITPPPPELYKDSNALLYKRLDDSFIPTYNLDQYQSYISKDFSRNNCKSGSINMNASMNEYCNDRNFDY